MSKTLQQLAEERGFVDSKRICPFERQNREIDGAYCIGRKCAWWDAGIEKCVVFRIWNNDASLEKEIKTVFGIFAGGED